MDDYSVNSLIESRNEWCARLLNILTPLIIQGFNSIFKEAYKVCEDNDEKGKYLMTFQNFISQIPKWSKAIVQKERERIVDKSGCSYLEDLIACVHIVQLKALSCIRVGQKQKKVDIDIPSLDIFIHNIYINCARKVYTNVYLFEIKKSALEIQRNNRDLEIIVKECLMDTIRESVPVDRILRAYMDETEEQDIETTEEIIEEPVTLDVPENLVNNDNNSSNINSEKEADKDKEKLSPENNTELDSSEIKISKINEASKKLENISLEVDTLDNNLSQTNRVNVELFDNQIDNSSENKRLKFNDTDKAMTYDGREELVSAPKTIDRLEQISAINFEKRKAEEDDDDEDEMLKIGDDVSLELDEIVSLDTM